MTLPAAPPHEESKDACCPDCGSLFHLAHPLGGKRSALPEFPPGYDPGEADRLIGHALPPQLVANHDFVAGGEEWAGGPQ